MSADHGVCIFYNQFPFNYIVETVHTVKSMDFG